MRKFRPRREPSSPPSPVDPQNRLTVSQALKVLVGSGVLLFICNLGYDAAQATLLRRMQLEAENKQLRAQLERIDHKVLPRLEQAHDEVKNIQQPLQHDQLTGAQQQQLAVKARGVCEALEEIEHLLKLNTVASFDKKKKTKELELADILIVLPNQATATPKASKSRNQGGIESPNVEPAAQKNLPESLSLQPAHLPAAATANAFESGAFKLPTPEKNLSFLGLPELPKSRKAADVHRVILTHKSSIQDCYTQVLREQPGLNGEIKVRLTIAPSGEVVDAMLLASTVNHPLLEELICERMKRWKDFGEVRAEAGNITFKQSFVLGQK